MVPTDPQPVLPVSRRDFVAGAGAVAAAAATQVAARSAKPGDDKPGKPAERESLNMANAAVKDAEKTSLKISREVWDLPAVGLKEQEAMEVHVRELEAAEFKITARKAGGHPTAFVAEWGTTCSPSLSCGRRHGRN